MLLFGERTNAAAIARAWLELQQAGICAVRPGCLSEDKGSLAASGSA
jgi:hypothetical protein